MSKHNRDRRKPPKYAADVMAAARRAQAAGVLPPGTVTQIAVYHDDWCALLVTGGPCDCNPVVGDVQPVPPEGGR